ncbi:LacI family DNA-binding transcriptional regulator [Nesterenkonia sp. PF2B19]|uniref:LacI family DNA-binding transcriptional regulator n=1 Tax=Nesterenkonia sp. PF2B19 TaxID=1881858 RepID=UPI0008730C9E|nr:LacI family DNA-binding transcriptional regulator [Nesterenkonia sp. PF2B19]
MASETTPEARPARAATIHEVARRAGVSHQTVSRYLRDMGPFRADTIARVEAAIKELDYRPNMIARSMRTRQTGVLTALLPAPVTQMPTPMLAAAAEAAHEAGYFMEIAVVEGPAEERSRRARELMGSGRVEGVLSLAGLPELQEQGKTAASGALTIVEQFDDKLRGLGTLADAGALREIISTLADQGHRRFLHIQGPEEWASARARRQVYEETLAERGLESHGVTGGDWSAHTGYQALQSLEADSGVTAVIAANDFVALGALRAAHERGWRVPEDLSIIGWDDIDLGRYSTPSLSTVAVDREGRGRLAMQRLIALVRGEEPPTDAPVPNHVVLRESTGPAPSATTD